MKNTLRTKSFNINIISLMVIISLFIISMSGCGQSADPAKNATNTAVNTTTNSAPTNTAANNAATNTAANSESPNTEISNTSPMAPANKNDTCDAPADNEVVVYEHIFSQDGGGKCVKLKPGEYKNAAAIGLENDSISSIKVGIKVRATVCDGENFAAPCEDFDKTDDDLTNNATIKNDTISSIKVIETKAETAEAKPAEVKALTTGLAGEWTNANETVKFTETMAEFRLLNETKPHNTNPYKVVDGKTVEFTDDSGKANKAIMTFEDNGNTLVWYRPDMGRTFKFKRVKAN